VTPGNRLCSIVRETVDSPPDGWSHDGFWFAFEAWQVRDVAQREEREFMARLTSCNAEGRNGVGGQPLTDDEAYSMMRRATRYGVHSFKHGKVELLVTVPTDERELAADDLVGSVVVLARLRGDDVESLYRYVTTGAR
jgi:hypothetical protein